MSDLSGYVPAHQTLDTFADRCLDGLDAAWIAEIGPAVYDLKATSWGGWQCSIVPMVSEHQAGMMRYWGEGLTSASALHQALNNAHGDRAYFTEPPSSGDMVCRADLVRRAHNAAAGIRDRKGH